MSSPDREKLIEALLAARAAVICDLDGQLAVRLIDEALAALPAEPEKERQVPISHVCPTCGADGGDLDDSSKFCDECDGTGRIDHRAEPVWATDPVRAALAELVALKDGPRDRAYYTQRPGAWNRARAALAADREPAPVQITDEMVENLAHHLYNEDDEDDEGPDSHWVLVGDGPYTGWKNEYRATARRYLVAALFKQM